MATTRRERNACAWCGSWRPVNDHRLCRSCMRRAVADDLVDEFFQLNPVRHLSPPPSLVCTCPAPDPETLGLFNTTQCGRCGRMIP